MKTLKFKSIQKGLVAMGVMLFFVTSCQKEKAENTILDEGTVSEEEFMDNLNNDVIAINYVTTLERFQESLGNSLANNDVTPDQFRQLYNNDTNSIDGLLQDSEIMEASTNFLDAREAFLAAYPNLLDNLRQYAPENTFNDGIVVEAKTFDFLDNEVAERGCRRWSRNWWGHKACLATCAVGTSYCAAAPPTCAVAAVVCATFCTEWYCG